MKIFMFIALGVLCMSLVAAAWARPVQTGSIRWRAIASGGARLEQGPVNLDNTLGQSVVGGFGDGDADLCVGFWCRLAAQYELYIPLTLRDYAG